MGCVGGKTENEKKGPRVSSIVKTSKDEQPASKVAAAPVAQAKLTPQEIQQKREVIKKSLEQGHAVPPSIAGPDFGAVATFDLRN